MGPFNSNENAGITLPPVTITAPANTQPGIWENLINNIPNLITAFVPPRQVQQPMQTDLLNNPLFLIVAGTAIVLALKK